ncbi:hypothetical protein C1J03_03650 [Sulfitobacter sp. SK012]|uniref:helix-turn-helix transcriptional regulator n=1 Tax=Sulfitobacter sp. SK012 TaxID=1389005 RepID=UPI000E0B04CD|nr:AlpA family phage regulatory protein [Sulfitobacter sp. SK012]AXI45212.1 hypothetical protein C1J03_03650 [Sulfitobacter sp. SK012]
MKNKPHQSNGRWWRDTQVADHFAVSRPTVWNWTKDVPGFPQPRRFGVQAKRWDKVEVLAYEGDEPGYLQ